jgi:hypothetical protein
MKYALYFVNTFQYYIYKNIIDNHACYHELKYPDRQLFVPTKLTAHINIYE